MHRLTVITMVLISIGIQKDRILIEAFSSLEAFCALLHAFGLCTTLCCVNAAHDHYENILFSSCFTIVIPFLLHLKLQMTFLISS